MTDDEARMCEACGEYEHECRCHHCPCCELPSINVGETIYCTTGCELKWQEHGALQEDGYPDPCPHLTGRHKLVELPRHTGLHYECERCKGIWNAAVFDIELLESMECEAEERGAE